MLDLSSILLRLDVDINFKPHKRKFVWYLDNGLVGKLNILDLTISVPVFFSLSLFNIPFVAVLALFYITSFRGSIYFFFIIFAIFLLLLILLSLCLCSLLPASCWDGLFIKKEFILLLSCVSGAIIVFALDVHQFIKVKTSICVSPISSDSLF